MLATRTIRSLPLALLLALGGCDGKGLGPAEFSRDDQPDYAIAEVTYHSAGGLHDLSTVSFKVRVENRGEKARRGTTVTMHVDGAFRQEMAVQGLDSRADTTITFAWPAQAGVHRFRFHVDRPLAGGPASGPGAGGDTAGLSLSVPYADRRIAEQRTTRFSELPIAMASDSLVQRILATARDSGYIVSPGSPMIRTRYEGQGITAFHVPLAPLDAPAGAAPVLSIIGGTGRTDAVFAYIFVVDGADLVLYDTDGGVRVSGQGRSLQLLRGGAQAAACSEGVVWPCVIEVGIEPMVRYTEELARASRSGSMGDLVRALAQHGTAIALPAFPRTTEVIVDNPPKGTVVRSNPRQCKRCHKGDLQVWDTYRYNYEATDDRGPVTYLSSQQWECPCTGGTFVFKAQDNAGQVTSDTVSFVLPPTPVLTYPNDPLCHDQGSTK